ncbi:MAG: vitamin K epoxide reductase family protein [Bacteroidota bacterium]
MDGITATLSYLLKKLKVKHTRSYLYRMMKGHPNFPSLLSFGDTLTLYNVENFPAEIDQSELHKIPTPFLTHLPAKGEGLFAIVDEIDENTITYWTDPYGMSMEPMVVFKEKWQGTVILVEANEKSAEPDYFSNLINQWQRNLRLPFIWLTVLSVLTAGLVFQYENYSQTTWSLFGTYLIGSIFSVFLMLRSSGSQNKYIHLLCQVSTKTNCDSILKSPAAYLAGNISWAEIGLTYFVGSTIVLLLTGPKVIPVLAVLSILALPYVFWSLYYQARVAKMWCTLCLGVQAMLIANASFVLTAGNVLYPISLSTLAILALSFAVPIAIWAMIKPSLTKAGELDLLNRKIEPLKRNGALFQHLLKQNPQMPPLDIRDVTLTMGHPEALHTITFVGSLYCTPCAAAFKELEQTLQMQPDLKAQVVLLTSYIDKEKQENTVRHLMSISEEQRVEAMRSWYRQVNRDINQWSKKFPATISDQAESARKRQMAWCETANIRYTPSFFVNGYPMPEGFELKDLAYLLSENEAEEQHA